MNSVDSFTGDRRGASEVVGASLLIGIVIIGVLVILFTGLSDVGDRQDDIETSQAEQALTEFDGEATRVALDGTSSQRINLGLEGNSGTLDVEESSGNMRIIYEDELLATDGPELDTNVTLGTLIYENGDTTVGYQGGGVWRSDGPNSTMVSPPEITYEGNTLTLPIIQTKDRGSVHSDVQLSSEGLSEQLFPSVAQDQNLTNKVNTGTFQIIIESRYYEGWGQYFEEETEATVVLDAPEEGKVTIIFFGSAFSISDDAGIISTSGPGEVFISGTGGPQDDDPTFIDSYDSSIGPYEDTKDESGVLKSAGDVRLTGNAEIRGDTDSEGRIDLENDPALITGDANAEEGVFVDQEEIEPGDADETDQIGGNVTNDADVPELVPLPVENRVDNIEEENDNDDEDVPIEDGEIQYESNAQTLEPGTYYLDRIDMDGENLFLDAREGSITLAVNEYVTLGGEGSKIEVKGNDTDNVVRVWVASRGDSNENIPTGQGPAEGEVEHFYVGPEDQITVEEDRSPRFQVIGPADFTGGVRGTSDDTMMTGVVFAPTITPENNSEFLIRDSEYFGAIVTGNLSIDNKANVHFDRGILGVDVPLPEGALLDYLHVTRHEVEVEESGPNSGS